MPERAEPRWWRRTVGAALIGALVAVAAAPSPTTAAETDPPLEVDADWHTLATPPLPEGTFELLTLSTLPDAVSGGDVLVGVRGLREAQAAALRVLADGRDVTDAFAPVPGSPGEVRGLVTGLPLGESDLVAEVGDQRAVLTVRNHPVTGPIISGPHQEPFRCRTEEAGLGPALDDDCSAEPRYQWFYRSLLDQGFHELADPWAGYPDDVATTRRDDGAEVPFVVRVESRTINRGIARLAVLDDPAARGPDAPFTAEGWNGRVYHAFGESCGVGYQQGVNHPETVLGALDLTAISADNLLINLVGLTDRLGRGDITSHSTLTSFGVHCNPLISIETMMMLKEHIAEQYGPIEAIVGTNGSGAALQQYNAANNAPGLISAAIPTATFADIASTAMTVTDCGLLQRYYAESDLDWTPVKQAAVNGHNLLTGTELNAICQSWTDAFFDRVIAEGRCAGDDSYHPVDNPTGARCTIQDANVNLFGRDPETGFARRPLDNVGVQYGLGALRAGVISMEEFLDLNERIGGLDIDGRFSPERHAMDPEVASILYRLGGVIGRGALAETPVLDVAPYLDLIPVANIHEAVRPFTIRDRLRVRGHEASQVIWRGVLTQADAYDAMAEWLERVQAARPGYGGDHAAAVAQARPAGLGDRCAFGTIGGRLDLPGGLTAPLGLVELPLLPGLDLPDLSLPLRVDVPEDFDSGLGPCSLVLPVTATPRLVAGMPRSDDVVKCQRKPIDPADYPGGLTDEQRARLEAVFPDGVCDYTKPAAEDVERSLVWVSVGGEELEEPHELTWRVARSTPAPAGPSAGPSSPDAPTSPAPAAPSSPGDAAGGDRLPATGGAHATATAGLLAIAGAALWALRRRTA